MAGAKRRDRQAHAFAAETADVQVGRLMGGLELFCEGPAGVARALREARKAARSGGAGYDPARHAALLRLQRLGRKSHCSGSLTDRPVRAPAGAGARKVDHRPSNSAVER